MARSRHGQAEKRQNGIAVSRSFGYLDKKAAKQGLLRGFFCFRPSRYKPDFYKNLSCKTSAGGVYLSYLFTFSKTALL